MYDSIQKQIDSGLGFAAAALGVPHDVYRIGNSSSGNVLVEANRIATGVKMLTKIAYGTAIRESLEAEKTPGIMWYRVIGSLRNYRVGDIFVVNDPKYGAGFSTVNFDTPDYKGFALADRSPIKKALGGRLNTVIEIYRTSSKPDTGGRWPAKPDQGDPVVLKNGKFSIGQAGDPACQIPAGLVASGKSYGNQSISGLPGDSLKSSGWQLYVPALDGFIVHEGDRIVASDGSRYMVVVPYTQTVGASGGQWFLQREGP